MPEAVDPKILEQIKTILRRDLKLGQADLADDMPLVGGEMDLDSLDILLLVGSIEKQFGIKIPGEAVGKWVFQNISTLAHYVQDNLHTLAAGLPAGEANVASGTSSGVAAGDNMGVARPLDDLLSRLPHGPAFKFVTRVDAVEPGRRAGGAWVVAGDEWFFAGHFPGNPIVPGVLLTEAMGQLAGFATAKPDVRTGKLVHTDIRFDRPIAPPAAITLTAIVTSEAGPLLTCEVTASVAESVAARGSITLHLE